MRTTLDIDEDVLAAVKELARRRRRTAGEVLSALARQALTGATARAEGVAEGVHEPQPFYGFAPFPAEGRVVTNELIDDLREQEGL
jgi:predicted transcriptional regulator